MQYAKAPKSCQKSDFRLSGNRQPLYAPVAQLDRAIASDAMCRAFESHRAYQSGRFLRKTSLDELPQLFNILSGSMSFVGPRPLIPEEKEIRTLRREYGVYSVRPGMTGLAQVNGRDKLSIEEKALFDKEYVDKQSLWLDIKIMFKTVKVVLCREGISEGGEKGNTRRP